MDIFAILLAIAMLFGNASADCVATMKACQDFCCADSAGAGPNMNICDSKRIECKCFIPQKRDMLAHKKAFQKACEKAGLSMRFNQAFGTTRCGSCGAGSANCNNQLPTPPKTCRELAQQQATTTTAAPTDSNAKPTDSNSKCAVTGGCKYTMKDTDTLATAANTYKISTTNLQCLNPGYKDASPPADKPMCPKSHPYAYRPIDKYDYCCTTNTFSKGTQICDGDNVRCKDKDGEETTGCVPFVPVSNVGKTLDVPCPANAATTVKSGTGKVDLSCGSGGRCKLGDVCLEGKCVCKGHADRGLSCDGDTTQKVGRDTRDTDATTCAPVGWALLSALTAAQLLSV